MYQKFKKKQRFMHRIIFKILYYKDNVDHEKNQTVNINMGFDSELAS